MPGIPKNPQGGAHGAMLGALSKPQLSHQQSPMVPENLRQTDSGSPRGLGAMMGGVLTGQTVFAQQNAQKGQATSSLSFVEPSPSKQSFSVENLILNSFEQIDSDHNGFIAYDELLNKMRDPNVKGEKAATVALLILVHQAGGSELNDEGWLESGDGLSRKDIEKLSSDVSIAMGKGRDISVSKLHAVLTQKIDQAEAQKTPSGQFKLPQHTSEINYKTIDQNIGTGDCYFVAGVAALASQDPQKILDMMQDNQNGTYTVSFADKKVTISTPTDTEIALNSKGGNWMPILEKAYAHYRNGGDGTESGISGYLSNAFTQGTLDIPYPEANPYQKINARSLTHLDQTMQELTGNSGTLSLFNDTPLERLNETLKQAIKNNKMVIAGNGEKDKVDPRFIYAHAYAVTDYDEKTQVVSIKNPWGDIRAGAEPEVRSGKAIDGEYDGYFELSLEDFYAHFSFLTTEN